MTVAPASLRTPRARLTAALTGGALAATLLTLSAAPASAVTPPAPQPVTPTASAAALTPATGSLFGSSGMLRPDEDVAAAITRTESQSGRKVDIHRIYDSWDTTQPSGYVRWDVETGRTPVLSIAATRSNGSVVPWREIASGRHDADVVRHAQAVKSLGVPIFLIFHHEPEDDPGHGTASEYNAAWRRYVGIFRAQGVTNVAWTWNAMAYSFTSTRSGRAADAWYPGDDLIDWIAADGYNWYSCPGRSNPWTAFSKVFASFRAWGAARGKPLMLAEYGSMEDPAVPGRKAQWLSDAAATLKTWPEIKAVSYFNAHRACSWWVDSSASSVAAFTAMGTDPYFRVRPHAALSGSTALGPAPLPVTFSTLGSRDARGGIVRWELDPGDGSARRSGTGAPPATLTHTYAAGEATATLRVTGSSGWSDTASVSVTAAAAPEVTTWGAPAAGTTTAELAGRVDPNLLATSYRFEFGTTTAYGNSTPVLAAGAGDRWVPVAAALTGLAPNTTYHFRLVATSTAGTVAGQSMQFTTTGAPGASTGRADELTATGARLFGDVDPNGLATSYRFEYGVTSAYGSSTGSASAGSAKWGAGVSTGVAGLRPATTYHYRVVATNSAGTTVGADREFTTFGAPEVVTGGAGEVTSSTAKVFGSVDPNGLATSYRVEWGTATGYGRSTAPVGAGSNTWGGGVSVALAGLPSGTVVHYRLVATNAAGTAYGVDRTLTTRR